MIKIFSESIHPIKEIKSKTNYFIFYIYLYIMLLPWNIFNGQMGLLSIILFFWWIFLAKKNNYLKKLKDITQFKPLLILLFFFLFTYISLLWTSNLDNSQDSLRFYKYYWVFVPILFTSLSKEEAQNSIFLFILSLGLYAIFSILIYLNILSFEFTNSANPKGILAYAIVTPYMAIGFLSSILIVIYTNSTLNKVIFSISAILFLFALFINNGRGAQVAFFLTSIILLAINYKKLFNLHALLILGSFVILFFLVFNQSSQYKRFQDGYKNLINAKEREFSGDWANRAYMWYAAYYLIPKHPLIGAGAGDNIDEFIEFTKEHPSKAIWLRSYHNQHLDTLTRYGIIGLFLQGSTILLLIYLLRHEEFFFQFSLVFFSMTFFASLFDILLYIKPYNNVFMLIFVLLSIIAYKNKSIEPLANSIT